MFLFMKKHVPMILDETKTQTRRNHKRARALVGSIHQCRTMMLNKDSTFARIKILRVWQERVYDISEEDAQAEGGYTREEYIEGLLKMHKGKLKATDTVYCYEFELVKDCDC
jgi:hypothetical protein